MKARRARAGDVETIHALIAHYAERGLLLPRTLEEVREHVARFLVLVDEEKVQGCVALEPYGADLAEVRSLAVSEEMQGHGAGARLLEYALAVAKRRKIARVFAVTHAPEFFARQGFHATSRHAVPEKIARDCNTCPKAPTCELLAVVKVIIPVRVALPVLPAERAVPVA